MSGARPPTPAAGDGRADLLVPPPAPLCLVGPTATGKTALAVAVALRRPGTELLNADSRQTVRGLAVGTCAPTLAELRGVPCHLLGIREPGERFSVADWLRHARARADEVTSRRGHVLLVGGTGLYVEAFVDGLVEGVPPAPAELRREREARAATPEGLTALAGELTALDPDAASAVDLRNPRRVVRALEIVEGCGSLSAARHRRGGRGGVLVGLDAPPALHDDLVRQRARRLLGTGLLIEEVDSALARGVSRDALDAAGIGYREALAVRDGLLTPEQAVEMLTRRTRRYAKAQRTWFRRDPRIRWLERGAGPVETLVDEVLDALHQDAGTGERLPGRR